MCRPGLFRLMVLLSITLVAMVSCVQTNATHTIESDQDSALTVPQTSVVTAIPSATITPTNIFAGTLTPTTTRKPAELLTASPSPSRTLSPTPEATSTITPTYAILRGEVLVRSNCRYGPGAPYLYKYGLLPGSNLEVIGRTDAGKWILVQAIGGDNPCWLKASLMAIQGDVMSLAPTSIPLPPSPYYGPPYAVSATREGNEVNIFWHGIQLRAGDETASPPYLVEAWVCRDGELIFIPIGSYTPFTTVIDESGCSQPSHGQVYIVEKHGYSRPAEIPWPPAAPIIPEK